MPCSAANSQRSSTYHPSDGFEPLSYHRCIAYLELIGHPNGFGQRRATPRTHNVPQSPSHHCSPWALPLNLRHSQVDKTLLLSIGSSRLSSLWALTFYKHYAPSLTLSSVLCFPLARAERSATRRSNKKIVWTMDLSAQGLFSALPTSYGIHQSSEDKAV